LQDFSFRPHLRVVGFCIRSVVAILPVGLITFVGIRNFNIPGNPGSPDWPSALRLLTSSGFGSVDSSVARFVFLPCAALRRPWGFHIELPCGSCLLCPYMMSIIGSLLQRGLILFYLSGLTARFSAVQRFQLCFVAKSHSKSSSLSILRCACSSIPYGQSVQGATCPLTLSCIPAFGFCLSNLLLRVKNFCFFGVSASLLLRSLTASFSGFPRHRHRSRLLRAGWLYLPWAFRRDYLRSASGHVELLQH
jgi:hypothetical protein